MANSEQPPISDLELRVQMLAELRGAFREAVSICDWAALRLRAAQSEAEADAIGTEIEGFFRRVCLGALALSNAGLADLPSTGGSSVTPDKEK